LQNVIAQRVPLGARPFALLGRLFPSRAAEVIFRTYLPESCSILQEELNGIHPIGPLSAYATQAEHFHLLTVEAEVEPLRRCPMAVGGGVESRQDEIATATEQRRQGR